MHSKSDPKQLTAIFFTNYKSLSRGIKFAFLFIGLVIVTASCAFAYKSAFIDKQDAPDNSDKAQETPVRVRVTPIEPIEQVKDAKPPEPKPQPEQESKPEPKITLSNPSVKENDDDMQYTYAITLNTTAIETYTKGIKYAITNSTCNKPEMFADGINKFTGSFAIPKDKLYISIKIKEDNLKSKTGLTDSTYTVSDINGTKIISGKTKVPSCNSSNEKNDNGSFRIEKE
jgi:hypothetical protein